MIVFTYINENIERVKKDTAVGLMPCSVLRHWEIYARFDALKKMNYKTSDAVLSLSEVNKISERAIYKIIEQMQKEI